MAPSHVVAALCFVAVDAGTILGVAPEEQAKYQGATLKCDSGSVEVSATSVNDNFCDCVDGSDEPGTGACAGQDATLFYCSNVGSTPKRVYASRVNDGICDCCDGSDEAPQSGRKAAIKCADNCAAQGSREKLEREEKAAALRIGLSKKKGIIAQALKDREDWKKETTQLKAELPALEKVAEELKQAREVREAAEKAAKTAEKEAADATKVDTKVDPSCMWRQTGGCVSTGDREAANDKPCTESITAGASGFCDCNGDGELGLDEHGFACNKAPDNCWLLCPAVEVSVYWVDTEADPSTISVEDGKMIWHVAKEKSKTVEKLDITEKDGKFSVSGPFGKSTIVEPASDEAQVKILMDLVRLAESNNILVEGDAGLRLKVALEQEKKGADVGEEKKVSEYAKWMEDAEQMTEGAEKKDGETKTLKPKVSEYSKWMEGAEEVGAGVEDDDESDEDDDDGEDYVPQQHVAKVVDNGAEKDLVKAEKDKEDEAKKQVRQNKDRSNDLKKMAEAITDEHLGYASLMGKKLEKRISEFNYKMSFFGKADQDHTSLGTWSTWTGPKSGEFTAGTSCWQGPARKLSVEFQCGVEEEILDVYEPSRCIYAAVVTHPGACLESDLELLARPPVVGPHDEL